MFLRAKLISILMLLFLKNNKNKIMEKSSNYISPIFVGHGGGPLPILGDKGHAEMVKYIKKIPNLIKTPKEILIISAHWEETEFTILDNPNPNLLYDYYGFPQESYNLNYPIKLAGDLNKKLIKIFEKNQIVYKTNKKRDFDHGVFIPLMLMYPKLDIPVTQISMMNSLNPKEHIKLGEALAELSNEGVLIMGSGMTFHNMSSFFSKPDSASMAKANSFHEYLKNIFIEEKNENNNEEISKKERMQKLENWKKAEGAKFSHPREEHLAPLFVAAGASLEGKGIVNEYYLMGFKILNVVFNSEKNAEFKDDL